VAYMARIGIQRAAHRNARGTYALLLPRRCAVGLKKGAASFLDLKRATKTKRADNGVVPGAQLVPSGASRAGANVAVRQCLCLSANYPAYISWLLPSLHPLVSSSRPVPCDETRSLDH